MVAKANFKELMRALDAYMDRHCERTTEVHVEGDPAEEILVIPIYGGELVLHSMDEHGSGKFYLVDTAD